MGIYDFFKGECPKCGNQLDMNSDGEKTGDIQTNMFNPTQYHCFREFSPGSKVPFAPKQTEVCIGETTCCRTIIDAIFDGDLLAKYKVTDE